MEVDALPLDVRSGAAMRAHRQRTAAGRSPRGQQHEPTARAGCASHRDAPTPSFAKLLDVTARLAREASVNLAKAAESARTQAADTLRRQHEDAGAALTASLEALQAGLHEHAKVVAAQASPAVRAAVDACRASASAIRRVEEELEAALADLQRAREDATRAASACMTAAAGRSATADAAADVATLVPPQPPRHVYDALAEQHTQQVVHLYHDLKHVIEPVLHSTEGDSM